jgi:hypothetical protein
VEYYCALIKVDWLAACFALRVVGAVFVIFLRRWRTILHNSPANRKQMFQTLLTNKKQGNLDKVQAANIIKPM